ERIYISLGRGVNNFVAYIFAGAKNTGFIIADTGGKAFYFLKTKSPDTVAGIFEKVEGTANLVSGGGNQLSDGAGGWVIGVGQSTSKFTSNTISGVNKRTLRGRGRIARIFESIFDNQPTEIRNVQVAEVGKDYAIITWETNHHTVNNKANYGEDLTYGNDAWSEDYSTGHKVLLTELEPDKEYVFEVMGRNSNYIYDANRTFRTTKD
ncbi:unnamed protein product, partial [marine sediment metagenome]